MLLGVVGDVDDDGRAVGLRRNGGRGEGRGMSEEPCRSFFDCESNTLTNLDPQTLLFLLPSFP